MSNRKRQYRSLYVVLVVLAVVAFVSWRLSTRHNAHEAWGIVAVVATLLLTYTLVNAIVTYVAAKIVRERLRNLFLAMARLSLVGVSVYNLIKELDKGGPFITLATFFWIYLAILFAKDLAEMISVSGIELEPTLDKQDDKVERAA